MSAAAPAIAKPPPLGARRWLAILGIGEDGLDGLSPRARRLLGEAELVVGGRRHLDLAGPLSAERLVWPSPIDGAYPAILARRGRPVVVLASGDPFFYGIGSVLAGLVPAEEIECLPAPSAFSLAAARLGWAFQGCRPVTLHGRAFARIRPELQPGARLLVLSWDGTTPARIAAELAARGMGASRLVVLEHLGGPRERVVEQRADDLGDARFADLNTVAVEVAGGPDARTIALAPGRPDADFDNDGQITRAEIRAMTLAALAPRRGELLWDVGAGSGSVAIEWMLADPANRAVAIEARADRAHRIRGNAERFGVPDLAIVEGRAPAVLAGLAPPDAVFVGGGLGEAGMFEAAWAALRPGGRLVVNAVTIETQGRLFDLHAAHGGRLVHVQLAEAGAVGGFRGFRPGMPIVQWTGVKP